MKISDYNHVARLYGNEEYTLAENEYMIVADFDSMITLRNMALEANETISLFGQTLVPKYQRCQNGIVELSGSHINAGIILVPDDVVDEQYLAYNSVVGNYRAKDKKEKQTIEAELFQLQQEVNREKYVFPSLSTKLSILEAGIGLGALITFIGLYLGIIFLISSAAILALKELSEAADNRERFTILRRIGADEKMIQQALFVQIGIFFLFPLFLAIIHSIFGIQFCNIILETFGTKGLIPSILMTAIFLVVIYGGYFLLTYFCSKSMMRER